MRNLLTLYIISLVFASVLFFCSSDRNDEKKHKQREQSTSTEKSISLKETLSTATFDKTISTIETSTPIGIQYSFNDDMIGKILEIKGILKDFRTDKQNVYLFIDKVDASSIQFYISIYNEKLKRKAFLLQYEKVKIKGILQKASEGSIAQYKLHIKSIEKLQKNTFPIPEN